MLGFVRAAGGGNLVHAAAAASARQMPSVGAQPRPPVAAAWMHRWVGQHGAHPRLHPYASPSASLHPSPPAMPPPPPPRGGHRMDTAGPRALAPPAARALSGPSEHVAQQAALATARLYAAPVGVGAGLFGSMVGVGGGVLIVPILTGLCSVSQKTVTGSSLAAVISTGLVAAYTYADYALVDFDAALVMSSAAVLFAPAGARLMHVMDCTALKRVLGYFLVTASLLVPLKAYVFAMRTAVPSGPSQTDGSSPSGSSSLGSLFSDPFKASFFGTTGGLAGFASGLLGIGGGTLVTPLMALFTSMAQSSIVGTSLFAMIPPSAVGLAQHYRLGNVDVRLATALALGTGIGSAIGSNVAVRAPDGSLEAVFSVGMLFLGWRTLCAVRR